MDAARHDRPGARWFGPVALVALWGAVFLFVVFIAGLLALKLLTGATIN